jgi:hypothetical protein
MPRSKHWKSEISSARKNRDKYLSTWRENVNFRKGKPGLGSDRYAADSRSLVAVPIDASYTKAKIASLFSVVPAVTVTPKDPRYAQAAPAFAKELSELLQDDAKVDRCMEECLADVVNASGIAAVKVGYEATFEDVDVPAIDVSLLPPEQAMALMASGSIPMETVPKTVDERFYAQRISPANLLWPASFAGSDFDESPWIGCEDKISVSQAKRRFKLTDAQIEEVKGAGNLETLNDEQECTDDEKCVTFSEIYFHAADYDSNELYFDKIRRVVFIEGLDEPVISEDLQWQKWDDESGRYIGICKYPIRVLTLTYISDEAVPPSDSENGRAQVLEIMRTRGQILEQRDHSKPIRWADTNRMDPQVLDLLQRGDWQGIIPTQGEGSRVIGEVARAHYPQENWDFDRVARNDLNESWQLGANQTGQYASGERSASEAAIIQSNFSTRVGFERAKVAKFFVSIAEVLAGLLQLYKDRPEELIGGQQSLQAIQSLPVNAKVALSIKPDSTVLLEASAKIDRLMKTLNLVGKSGYINVEPIIAEIVALSGLDPAQVMTKPQPPPPEAPNFSARVSGEDFSNPFVIALIQKQQNITPEEIQAAKLLIADLAMPVAPPSARPASDDMEFPNDEPAQPVGRPTLASQANPEWSAMDRITKRVDEMGG